MVLQYGADARWADAFRDEDEHRDAWIRNRDRLLAWCRHGHRPAAWWQFEAGDLQGIRATITSNRRSIRPESSGEEECGRTHRASGVGNFSGAGERTRYLSGPGRFLKGAPARRRAL